MEFFLIAILTTSSEVSNIKHDILLFTKEFENLISSKENSDLKNINIIKIENNKIKISISSGKYSRSHDILLRLKKNLSLYLGNKFKIGIRSTNIELFEIYIHTSKIIEVKSIPYIKKIEFENEKIKISLNVSESEIRKQIPDRIIKLITDKLNKKEYGSKSEHWNLLWESKDKKFSYFNDPTEDMIKEGWISRGTSRGQWIYGYYSTKIFRTFEKIVESELLKPLGFNEMIFPKLVTWDIWKKSGHANGIYPEMYYVCAPKTRDPNYWEDVIDYYKVTHEVPTSLIKNKITDPIGGLCYAQCPPSWVYFQGKTVSNESIPIKIFDRSGTSHRYESGGIHGIERVDEFHRIEIVWIGLEDDVLTIADQLHEKYKYIFNDILDLKWRKAWVTPWFMAQEGILGLSSEKKVGTVDYEAPLPYKGVNSEWLEFQNLSINGNKYPKGFNLKLQSGSELWSGCSGVGLERWTSVFLSQHGLDINNWPEKFVNIFGSTPNKIKFL